MLPHTDKAKTLDSVRREKLPSAKVTKARHGGSCRHHSACEVEAGVPRVQGHLPYPARPNLGWKTTNCKEGNGFVLVLLSP